MLKQIILIRTDIKMGKGKLASQAAHASVEAFYRKLEQNKEEALTWLRTGAKKIVLRAEDENMLIEIYNKAKLKGLVAVLIADSGLTQLQPGTITALGIGPDEEQRIDEVCGELKLL